MKEYQKIHERALACAKRFHQAESELMDVLEQVDDKKVFRALGYSSLFDYATRALSLSENHAYAFITVARKSKEVPQIKNAIEKGELNVSKARRVCSVITAENQKDWIQKAATLPQREVEKEVARTKPSTAIKERVRAVCENRLELRCGISESLDKKLKRVQDLESQRQRKTATLEGALEAMAELYLEKKDPLKKAERARPKTQKKEKLDSRREKQRMSIPASIRHQVNQRDNNQCTFKDSQGTRCTNRRWLHLHHVKEVGKGGRNSVENITTLCALHHQRAHLALNQELL